MKEEVVKVEVVMVEEHVEVELVAEVMVEVEAVIVAG